MQRRFFSAALVSVSLAALGAAPSVWAQAVLLRVLTHSSFDLPKELLAQFEKDAGVKLQIVKAGDAGEMVNKLILTKARPIADVVYGIDNTLLPRAVAAKLLDAYTGPAAQRAPAAALAAGAAKPAYAKLLVVQNPATSSPGQAFVFATIAGLGEEAAFTWWGQMRANGVKVVKGWTEAYYTEFTRNGGTRELVVSYASSPAAEVFYAKEKLSVSPTTNLFFKGGVFRQVEGVALVKGGNPAARDAAGQFIEFLRSAPAQQALQTTMWMFPAEAGAARVEVMKQHASEPTAFDNPGVTDMNSKGKAWLQRWTKVVLK